MTESVSDPALALVSVCRMLCFFVALVFLSLLDSLAGNFSFARILYWTNSVFFWAGMLDDFAPGEKRLISSDSCCTEDRSQNKPDFPEKGYKVVFCSVLWQRKRSLLESVDLCCWVMASECCAEIDPCSAQQRKNQKEVHTNSCVQQNTKLPKLCCISVIVSLMNFSDVWWRQTNSLEAVCRDQQYNVVYNSPERGVEAKQTWKPRKIVLSFPILVVRFQPWGFFGCLQNFWSKFVVSCWPIVQFFWWEF